MFFCRDVPYQIATPGLHGSLLFVRILQAYTSAPNAAAGGECAALCQVLVHIHAVNHVLLGTTVLCCWTQTGVALAPCSRMLDIKHLTFMLPKVLPNNEPATPPLEGLQ